MEPGLMGQVCRHSTGEFGRAAPHLYPGFGKSLPTLAQQPR